MLIIALKILGVLWFTIGTLLCAKTLHHLFDPDLQPARNEWRRHKFGELEASRRAAYYNTNFAFLNSFIIVILFWPAIFAAMAYNKRTKHTISSKK